MVTGVSHLSRTIKCFASSVSTEFSSPYISNERNMSSTTNSESCSILQAQLIHTYQELLIGANKSLNLSMNGANTTNISRLLIESQRELDAFHSHNTDFVSLKLWHKDTNLDKKESRELLNLNYQLESQLERVKTSRETEFVDAINAIIRELERKLKEYERYLTTNSRGHWISVTGTIRERMNTYEEDIIKGFVDNVSNIFLSLGINCKLEHLEKTFVKHKESLEITSKKNNLRKRLSLLNPKSGLLINTPEMDSALTVELFKSQRLLNIYLKWRDSIIRAEHFRLALKFRSIETEISHKFLQPGKENISQIKLALTNEAVFDEYDKRFRQNSFFSKLDSLQNTMSEIVEKYQLFSANSSQGHLPNLPPRQLQSLFQKTAKECEDLNTSVKNMIGNIEEEVVEASKAFKMISEKVPKYFSDHENIIKDTNSINNLINQLPALKEIENELNSNKCLVNECYAKLQNVPQFKSSIPQHSEFTSFCNTLTIKVARISELVEDYASIQEKSKIVVEKMEASRAEASLIMSKSQHIHSHDEVYQLYKTALELKEKQEGTQTQCEEVLLIWAPLVSKSIEIMTQDSVINDELVQNMKDVKETCTESIDELINHYTNLVKNWREYELLLSALDSEMSCLNLTINEWESIKVDTQIVNKNRIHDCAKMFNSQLEKANEILKKITALEINDEAHKAIKDRQAVLDKMQNTYNSIKASIFSQWKKEVVCDLTLDSILLKNPTLVVSSARRRSSIGWHTSTFLIKEATEKKGEHKDEIWVPNLNLTHITEAENILDEIDITEDFEEEEKKDEMIEEANYILNQIIFWAEEQISANFFLDDNDLPPVFAISKSDFQRMSVVKNELEWKYKEIQQMKTKFSDILDIFDVKLCLEACETNLIKVNDKYSIPHVSKKNFGNFIFILPQKLV